MKLYQETVKLSNLLTLNSTLLKVSLSHYLFSHICELDCAKAWPVLISCSLSSSLELQTVFTSVQATWTSGYRSLTQGLVSLILIFFHSEDLLGLTRRQITNFRS